MRHHLRAHARLRPKTGDAGDGGEDPAHLGGFAGGRIGEQRAVLGLDDVDGEVGVVLGEFGGQLLVEGQVY